ncbi:unnamed protein product, partial [Adineta ricciae]
ECSDADDLLNVTSCPNMIAPDAALYTLHRNDAQPQLCPIQPPLHLTSLTKDGSTCHQSSLSKSYISECANDNQFHLHLASCSSYQRTLDLQLLCVGTWIDGFHTYFVTRILSKLPNIDSQYACFHLVTRQEDLSTSVSLSMATDDSCRDLNSKYMPTIMTLSSPNRHKENESNRTCTFPEEFQQSNWYSLNRSMQMIIKHTDIELVNFKDNGSNQRFHCLQTRHRSDYRIRSFNNCHTSEECLHIHRRTHNVIELVFHDCTANGDKRKVTFVTKSRYFTSCPTSIGHLLLETNHYHHHQQIILRKQAFQMSVGCANREKLMIYQTEKDPEYRLLTQTDTCLASWQSDDHSTIYLIAQSIYSNASYCLIFSMASSKQAKKLFNQGRKIATSTANKRSQPVSEGDVRVQDTDDSQEEILQHRKTYHEVKHDKRQQGVRPNAFLSFRITNQEIIDCASEIQKQIIKANPLLSQASTSIPTLHVTLMVFALKTDEDRQRLVK